MNWSSAGPSIERWLDHGATNLISGWANWWVERQGLIGGRSQGTYLRSAYIFPGCSLFISLPPQTQPSLGHHEMSNLCSNGPSQLSPAVLKSHYQTHREERVYRSYTFLSWSIIEGNQGRKLRWEPAGRNWSRGDEGTLLIGLLSLFSYLPQDRLPRVAPHMTDLALAH